MKSCFITLQYCKMQTSQTFIFYKLINLTPQMYWSLSEVTWNRQRKYVQLNSNRIELHKHYIVLFSGGIFDESTNQIRSAFAFELNRVNSNPEQRYRVRLNPNLQRTRINDSFSLTTTSEYRPWLAYWNHHLLEQRIPPLFHKYTPSPSSLNLFPPPNHWPSYLGKGQ